MDFEHPTCKGRCFIYIFKIECFCPYRASILWQSVTQGVASLALGYVLLPFQGVQACILVCKTMQNKIMDFETLPETIAPISQRNIADSFFTKEPAMFYFLCIHIGVDGILFNKFTTRTYIITHQHREYVVGVGSIFE